MHCWHIILEQKKAVALLTSTDLILGPRRRGVFLGGTDVFGNSEVFRSTAASSLFSNGARDWV